jgi:hypothetical protein
MLDPGHRPTFRSILMVVLVGLVLTSAAVLGGLWLVFGSRISLVLSLVISTVLATVLAIRLSRVLAEPLERLRHNALAVASESEVGAPNLAVPREIAILASAFHDMADRIVARRKELVLANAEVGRARDEIAVREERLRRQNAALVGLARHPAMTAGELGTAFRSITETAASFLGVERASIWLLEQDGRRMICQDLHVRALGTHLRADELAADRTPRYFAALHAHRHIAASDAQTDPRTSELTADYLLPLGISSMLDTAIMREGKIAGVLCLEHVGQARVWASDEEAFAASLTDFATLALEAAEHRRDEEALRASTAQLERINEELRLANERLRKAGRETTSTG